MPPEPSINAARARAIEGRPSLHGAALARGFPGQIARGAADLTQRTRAVAEGQHDARTQRPPHGGQAFPGDRRRVGRARGQPHAVIAADQRTVTRGGLADVQDRGQRNPRWAPPPRPDAPPIRRRSAGPSLALPACRPRRNARARAGRARPAARTSMLELDSSVGRSSTPKSLTRTFSSGRYRPFAVEAADQCARLPRDEPVGQLNYAGHLAQARLGRDGRLNRPVRQFVAGHPDDDLLGTDSLSHERGAAQDEVWRADHEHLVLDAARLALGGVDDHDRLAVVRLGVVCITALSLRAKGKAAPP